MVHPFLERRLTRLAETQNSDGGWGYFPGKQSWTEPTAWAMIALRGSSLGLTPLVRGTRFLERMALEGGALAASPMSKAPHWSTALGLTAIALCSEPEDTSELREKLAGWLLDSEGAESTWLIRAVGAIAGGDAGRNRSFKGWPWIPDTSAWVEPTVHSLVALRVAGAPHSPRKLARRLDHGRQMLLSLRTADGGWNYGSRSALGIALPSYPETTALALIGLAGSTGPEVRGAVELAVNYRPAQVSRLARAWLSIAFQLHGAAAPVREDELPSRDLLEVALEAVGGPGGNARLLAGERS